MSERRNSDDTSDSNLGAYILAGIAGVAAGVIGYYGAEKFFETPSSNQVTDRPPSTTNLRRYNYQDSWQNPTHQHTTNKNYTDTDPDCAICLKKMMPVRELPCKHRFHDHCITKWVNQKPVCPKCNASTQ